MFFCVKTPASLFSCLLGGVAVFLSLAGHLEAGLREQIESKYDYNTVRADKKWEKSLYEGMEFSNQDFKGKEFNFKGKKGENKKILSMPQNESFGKVFDNSKRASGFEQPFADSGKKFAGFEGRSGFDGKMSDWSKAEAKLGGKNQDITFAKENDRRVVENKMFQDNRKMYDAPEVKKIRQDVDIISEAAKRGVELKDGKISIDQIKEILNKN